jgi:hypothetical protein
LRRIFRPKREEETGEWRKLHNEELMICTAHQCCSGDKLENGMSGACSAYGGEKRRVRVLVRKPEGKRSLGRPRPRWEDNIKADLQDVECGGMDWIDMLCVVDRASRYMRVMKPT